MLVSATRRQWILQPAPCFLKDDLQVRCRIGAFELCVWHARIYDNSSVSLKESEAVAQ